MVRPPDERIAPTELAALRRFAAAMDVPSPPSPLCRRPGWSWLPRSVPPGPPTSIALRDGRRRRASVGPRPQPGPNRDDPCSPASPTSPPSWSSGSTTAPACPTTWTHRQRDAAPGRLRRPRRPRRPPLVGGLGRGGRDGVAGVVPAAAPSRPRSTPSTSRVWGTATRRPTSANSRPRAGSGCSPGLPTNSVDGGPAAPLATDAATWWTLLTARPAGGRPDVSTALTGDPDALGNLPGGDRPHRHPAAP